TEIVNSKQDLTYADLIPEESVVVTLSHRGYAKTQPLQDYQAQHRGGRGKSATAIKDEDFIEKLLIASSHDTILCFTNRSKVYWLKDYEIPQGSRGSRGRPMVNILPLGEDERVTAILPVDLEALQQRAGSEDEIEDNDGVTIEGELVEADVEAGDDAEVDSDDDNDLPTGEYIFMATAKGTVKKTPLVQFSRPRSNGLIALRLEEGDTLISAAITDGAREVMLFSDGGKVLRFKEKHVRPMGRTARGVRGMKLPEGQRLVSMIIPQPGVQILSASERGYGKRTLLDEYPRRGRGGQGVIAMVINERNGKLVGALQVVEGDEMML